MATPFRIGSRWGVPSAAFVTSPSGHIHDIFCIWPGSITGSIGSGSSQKEYYPILIRNVEKFDAFYATGSGGSGNVRFALYDADESTNWYPKTVLEQTAEVTAPTTSTVYVWAAPRILAPGWYWVGVSTSSVWNAYGMSSNYLSPYGVSALNSANRASRVVQTGSASSVAYVDNPTINTTTRGSNFQRVGIRRSA